MVTEKLEIFEEPLFDSSLISLQEHTYKPYGSPKYNNSDEIRIPIHFQDLILDICDSYIYIEGTFIPEDDAKACNLSNNAFAFLFEEIRYEMGGEAVTIVRKPGITTTLKTMVSFNKTQANSLASCGWGLSSNYNVVFDPVSHIFSGRLPLKYLMGFAEDYTKGIFNVKQELILIIARTFNNCYIGEVNAALEITKIEWKIRHIVPEDKQKLKLLSKINKSTESATVKVPYRTWDLYELPALRETASDVWSIRTTTNLERPRFIVVGFQKSSNYDRRSADATRFTDANLSNMRLFLNSEGYPCERWNLDFTKKLIAPAYYAYHNFQNAYYGREINAEPMMDLQEFFDNPLFVIDCSHQSDSMKSSTVDIKMEFEAGQDKFPKDTKVYALIIHDSYLTYNILNGDVSTGVRY